MKEGVTAETVAGVVTRWRETTVDWASIPAFAILGIDEIALTKGHRNFVALLTARTPDHELHVLAVLPDRKTETVVAWLQHLPADRKAAITRVCTDMWEGGDRAGPARDAPDLAPHPTGRTIGAPDESDPDGLRDTQLRQSDLDNILWHGYTLA